MDDETADAIRRVNEAADEHWKKLALDAVRVCAQVLPEFTTDDIWNALSAVPDAQTHDRRAMGAILQDALRLGIIEKATCQSCGTLKITRMSKREGNKGRWDVTVFRPGPNA